MRFGLSCFGTRRVSCRQGSWWGLTAPYQPSTCPEHSRCIHSLHPHPLRLSTCLSYNSCRLCFPRSSILSRHRAARLDKPSSLSFPLRLENDPNRSQYSQHLLRLGRHPCRTFLHHRLYSCCRCAHLKQNTDLVHSRCIHSLHPHPLRLSTCPRDSSCTSSRRRRSENRSTFPRRTKCILYCHCWHTCPHHKLYRSCRGWCSPFRHRKTHKHVCPPHQQTFVCLRCILYRPFALLS